MTKLMVITFITTILLNINTYATEVERAVHSVKAYYDKTLDHLTEEYAYDSDGFDLVIEDYLDLRNSKFGKQVVLITASDLSSEVIATIDKSFLNKKYQKEAADAYSYESPDGEYRFLYLRKSLFLIHLQNEALFVVTFLGNGGEWGRYSTEVKYLIIRKSNSNIIKDDQTIIF